MLKVNSHRLILSTFVKVQQKMEENKDAIPEMGNYSIKHHRITQDQIYKSDLSFALLN